MPEAAASAPASATPSAPTAPTTAPAAPPSSPSSAAPPSTAAVTKPSASSAPAAPTTPTKAEIPASPTGKQDVRSGLMEAAKAGLAKTRTGQPSAQQKQGSQATVAGPPSATAGKAASPGTTPEGVSEGATTEAAPSGEARDGVADPSIEDETKPPPFNEHPRWKKLTRDYETASARIKELEGPADQFQKIEDYRQMFGLEVEDLATAYDITAKLKHNPLLAYQALKPIWDKLCQIVGEVLPDDLQKRVKDGYLDEASAKELARARLMTKTAQNDATRINEQVQQGQQRQLRSSIQGAVARWDAQQVSKSPDFLRLRPFVEDAARAIIAREGQAKTPDEAVGYLDRALKAVTDRLQPFRPVTPGLNGSTPKQPAAGSPSSAVVAPEPKSLREAAQLGLEGRYRPN